MRFWHGRHAGPLIAVWVLALSTIGGLYALQTWQPALTELLMPIYVIIVVALLVATANWFRARARGGDRRHADRRHRERD